MTTGQGYVDFSGSVEVVSHFADPLWRLNNLYWIQTKGEENDESDGSRVVPFRMNDAQFMLYEDMHYKNIIPKARQLGMTTFIQLFMLDQCAFNSNVLAGVVAHNTEDAAGFFRNKIKFAYERMPEQLLTAIPIEGNSERELRFANKSSIRVGTSLRSGTYHYLHISEFGKLCAKYPQRAEEVVTGTLQAAGPSAVVFIESTAEGRAGHFYRMSMKARTLQERGKRLGKTQYKLHFFPWFKAREYVEDPNLIVVPQEMHDYFDALSAKLGITLSPAQRAWYCSKQDELGEDKMKQEFPSTLEEAFWVSMEGCYYTKQLTKARKDGRIRVLPTTSHPVYTFWDIGANDETAIWFMRKVGPEYRFIDYMEASGEAFEYFATEMHKKPYIYAQHFLPHDADQRRQGQFQNKTPREMLEELGLRNCEIVPVINRVQTGIQQVRDIFGQCWFDEIQCATGLVHLENYRKDWDARLEVWKDIPRHDKASNGSDAFRQFAQAQHNGQINFQAQGANWRKGSNMSGRVA